MKKTNTMTEEQILDSIINLYLEKNPREAKYGVRMTSTEDDSEQTYYYPLTEAEKELIHEYVSDNNDHYSHLDEFLDTTDEGKKLLEKLEIPESPFMIDIVDSCNLNDMHYFSEIEITVPGEGEKSNEVYRYNTRVDTQEFRDLMKIYIKRKNRVSVNMLTCLYPKFTSEMMGRIVNSLYDGIVEFDLPFTVKMVEISNAVESILNPINDTLDLFANAKDEMLEYIEKHAIVPCWEDLYEERTEKDCFHVFAGFEGNKFHVEQERITFKWMDDQWSDEDEQSFDANILCKYLNLNSYQELIDYMKEHFNTATAINDIREFVKTNCKEVML